MAPTSYFFAGAAVLLLVLCTSSPVSASLAAAEEAAPPLASDRIKHIVVLMLENRAFDHVLGWFPGVDGLNGTQFNLVNSSDPNSQKIYQTPNSPNINQCDPNHGLPATSYKIFGATAFAENNFTVPTMGGFVDFELNKDGNNASLNYCNVMESFTPDKLPILSTLASEYVLMDRFFASLPGPTWPNRMFFMAGTSSGLTETFPWYHDEPGLLFPTKTIFDQVTEAGGEWKVYYNDTPWELFVGALATHPEHMHSLGQFFDDCERGTLPDFAYINPLSGINISLGVGSNDEHPDHDMAAGERYIKDIYEAIRASPQWNETLFVLTYDEHGGFYDHVLPPMNVPAPGDGEASYPDKDFMFDRLGIRIPTILVSPWLPKGVIQNAPPAAQKPAANSEYDLTSIIASARKILPVLNRTGPLTKRDAWSATFEHLLTTLPEMRTDCPMHLPAPPNVTLDLDVEAGQPINELQHHIMTVHAGLNGHEFPHHIREQRHVGDWVHGAFHHHKHTTAHWKHTKANVHAPRFGADHFHVIVQPTFNKSYDSLTWRVNVPTNKSWAETHPQMTVSIDLEVNSSSSADKTEKVKFCLDSGLGINGTHVGVSRCYPSADPMINRDMAQLWVVEKDATIRPMVNRSSLCLTNAYFQGDTHAFLDVCVEGNVRQHWAYHGGAPGNPYGGDIFFSDWTTALKVVRL